MRGGIYAILDVYYIYENVLIASLLCGRTLRAPTTTQHTRDHYKIYFDGHSNETIRRLILYLYLNFDWIILLDIFCLIKCK